MQNNYVRLLGFCLIVMTGCLDSYPPPEGGENLNILVADGFLDTGKGLAIVRLLHSTPLSEDGIPAPEVNAIVEIHDSNGQSVSLIEVSPGFYEASALITNSSLTYQLQIRTADGQSYSSDNVQVTKSPPIDSISWKPSEFGVTVYANTHDDSDQSRYYRWEYVETWEYHAPFSTDFTTRNKQAILREPDDLIYTCYKTVPSTKIALGTSIRLARDVIYEQPLTLLPTASDQLMKLYSIIVTQRVLSKQEYEFWADLQRVTESLGGLFDSQPYQIVGNIHHDSDTSIPVLGYFSAGSTDDERIFISFSDLPQYLKKRPFHGCVLDTVCLIKTPTTLDRCSTDIPSLGDGATLIGPLSRNGAVWGYTRSSADCADCRKKGGVLEKPIFWP